MAFRIDYRGAVIQADTAQDVRELLVVLAQPLPQLLTAGELVAESGGGPCVAERGEGRVSPSRREPQPRRAGHRKSVAPVRRASRMGGGVDSAMPRASRGAGAARLTALDGQVLEAVRAGVSRPADLNARISATVFVVRQALKRLVARGAIRAEGVTMSRRYYPADLRPRAAAKEAVR